MPCGSRAGVMYPRTRQTASKLDEVCRLARKPEFLSEVPVRLRPEIACRRQPTKVLDSLLFLLLFLLLMRHSFLRSVGQLLGICLGAFGDLSASFGKGSYKAY